MMADPLELLTGEAPDSDPKMALALILRQIAMLLSKLEDAPTEGMDGRATEPTEIRVRPRIEPLGG